MDEQGPGLHEAVTALTAARELVGATQISAEWELMGAHHIEIVVDESGPQIFSDGEPVPMLKGGLA